MAPDWARATRPLVLIITGMAVVVTIVFNADVNAQGGAYATGVLMLMTSAAVAVSIALPDRRKIYVPIAIIFAYTTLVNIVERPEGKLRKFRVKRSQAEKVVKPGWLGVDARRLLADAYGIELSLVALAVLTSLTLVSGKVLQKSTPLVTN